MAIKPKRNLKERQPLEPGITNYFLNGEAPARGGPGWELYVSRHFDGGAAIRATWNEHKAALLTEWIRRHPGRRPWAWWEFDTPRTPIEGCEYKLEAQRLQIGGGLPLHRRKAIWPGFAMGIPIAWEDDDEIDDPPTYESEYAFLKRHGLLTATEMKGGERNERS